MKRGIDDDEKRLRGEEGVGGAGSAGGLAGGLAGDSALIAGE
jgi:hypothetical protein